MNIIDYNGLLRNIKQDDIKFVSDEKQNSFYVYKKDLNVHFKHIYRTKF